MSKFKKGAVSIVLAVSILVTFVCSFGGVTATASSSLNSQGLASNVQDGVILHAWNWSYNTIKNNMANIAAAGYSTVQTSPVQKPKDYGATWTQVSTQWWSSTSRPPLNSLTAAHGLVQKTNLKACATRRIPMASKSL